MGNREKITLEFDVVRLMTAVRERAVGGSKSLRDIESQCNVSASTLSRLDNGHMPDMETFVELCRAFKLSPGVYFDWVEWKGESVSIEDVTF